ncbi:MULTISPECIES: TetR/AcrR family transcriptional regulator [Streptomyces]|uniref:TetR family transcriptional regulator n=1 Tax=Streptomyces mirabilis TaxID=68239 RepID=A0ABU3UCD6_9ACTN|nr:MULTISPECIES: TetR/AcrR family transcriptional regulator [Streptomyces]MCX4616667.1 TetR family transcriptional regulator [Streptomyces mirabilis]MCX5354893.1 TetR family transcriptional regulator [Streptomyces mirabilis]MDU8991536.1 TetR family transcriptional regulator [Streptomyces mirabilis]SOE33368.1 transcriptional regulator, TetR family [Streptomyces sp. OK228]
MIGAKKTDLRREAGQRTRDGLQTAALELLAQRGQEGVTLREITDRAGANVAAVSYHFGSLKALCDSAIEHALERYLDAQILALDPLGSTSTLQEMAAAFARPMVRALAAGGQDLAVMRTVARVGIDPPQGWERLNGKFDQSRREALRVLTANLPGVDEQELIFRTRCAAGLLNWLALAPIGAELAAMSAEQIERQLVPVVAGAFRGDAVVGR